MFNNLKLVSHGYGCDVCLFPELKEAVEDVLPSLIEHGVTVLLMTKHCDTPGIESFSDKVDEASDSPLPQSLRSHITFKSPAVYIYTSGTTGTESSCICFSVSSDHLFFPTVTYCRSSSGFKVVCCCLCLVAFQVSLRQL